MNILMANRRRAARAPINPLDKATVVSILPKSIRETKPTLEPGVFNLGPGSFDRPSILVVGPSSWWREVDEEQPLIEIPTSAVLIAESIVNDYCNGILACDMAETMPGLFWLPGGFTHKELKEKYALELDKANRKQRNWYAALVKMADVLWSRSQGNPLAISDDMKLAAKELGFDNKEWLKNFEHVELVRCVACGNLNQSNVLVCPNCKVILKPEEFKKLQLQFASQENK